MAARASSRRVSRSLFAVASIARGSSPAKAVASASRCASCLTESSSSCIVSTEVMSDPSSPDALLAWLPASLPAVLNASRIPEASLADAVASSHAEVISVSASDCHWETSSARLAAQSFASEAALCASSSSSEALALVSSTASFKPSRPVSTGVGVSSNCRIPSIVSSPSEKIESARFACSSMGARTLSTAALS